VSSRLLDGIAVILWVGAVVLLLIESSDRKMGLLTAWEALLIGAAAATTVVAWLSRVLASLDEAYMLGAEAKNLTPIRRECARR